MKKLIALISSAGKSAEQLKKEVWEAFQKYERTKTKDDIVEAEITFLPTYKPAKTGQKQEDDPKGT